MAKKSEQELAVAAAARMAALPREQADNSRPRAHDAYQRAATNLPTGSPTHTFLNREATGRPLFYEDLSLTERGRADARYVEHHNTIQQRNEGMLVATNAKVRKQAADMAPHLKNNPRSLEDAAHAIGESVAHPTSRRLPTDPARPGAGWYFEHNEELRRANPTVESERLATTSGVMSPLNNPVQERTAAKAILDAQDRNLPMYVSKRAASAANKAVKGAIPEGSAGSRQFRELSADGVRGLVQAKDSVKSVDGRASRGRRGSLGNVDLESMALGGVNVGKGVAAARGAHLNELVSPASGPKVSTYVRSAEAYDSTDKVVREEYHRRATHLVNEPDQLDLSQAGSQFRKEFDPHSLTDDSFDVTEAHAAHLRQRLGEGDAAAAVPVGAKVKMSELHPAAVQAFAHSKTSETVDQRTHRLALLSSQHPTVQDSWLNAAFSDQEHLDLPSSNPFTTASLHKRAGSEKWGYWQGKKVTVDGKATDIIDKRPGANANTPSGIQHAVQDFGARAAAKSIRAKHDIGWDIPSTLVQESRWTDSRRDASKDPDYEAHATRERTASMIAEGRWGDLEATRPGNLVGRQFRSKQPQLPLEVPAQEALFDADTPARKAAPVKRQPTAPRKAAPAAAEGLF